MLNLDNEAIQILIFLAPGYISFRIYTLDQAWASIHIVNIFYGSLVFSLSNYVISALIIVSLGTEINQIQNPTLILWALVVSVGVGLFWKRIGHSIFHSILQAMGITNEDNEGDSWSRIFNNPKCQLTQIIVKLQDGTEYMCDDTEKFKKHDYEHAGIYTYYSDSHQSLIFVPTHKRFASCGKWHEAEGAENEDYGLRIMYVKRENVVRLDVRLLPTGSITVKDRISSFFNSQNLKRYLFFGGFGFVSLGFSIFVGLVLVGL